MANAIIALDAMGGDYGPSVVVPAALIALGKTPKLQLILVGDEAAIKQQLALQNACAHPRINIKHTSEVVAMDEAPALALRNKKDSSMRVSINLVKDNCAHACVSAGNTGALMATARFVLKTVDGIDRPAIITSFPTVKPNKVVRMLDLGANVDSSPEHLLEFAVMGSILASAIERIKAPKVGLLNIGTEAIKGNEQVKKTSTLLAEQPGLNFIGNVEGDQIYSGEIDVIVCDGFVGNVALKTSEGSIQLILHYLRDEFNHNWVTRMIGVLAKPILRRVKAQIDPTNYNGASFVGLKGIVVKSHGGASIAAFANAIEEAVSLVAQDIPGKIQAGINAGLLNKQDLA